jgi:hypothetical protein
VDSVQHIGVLEGVRGLSNFSGKLTAFVVALADLRDATVKLQNGFTTLDGSVKGLHERQALLQLQAKMEGQVTKTAYEVGKMMDSIRVPGNKKTRTLPSAAWNAVLVKDLPGYLNAAESLSADHIDLSPLLAEITSFLDRPGDTEAVVSEAEINTALTAFLSDKGKTPLGRGNSHKRLEAAIKKAGERYDRTYKLQAKGEKKTKPAKK